MHQLQSIIFLRQSKWIIKIGFLNLIFKINNLATGHFAPDRLQPRAPPLNNIFLFNKATLIFFLHQRRIVPKMEDRTEQNFQRSIAVSLFSILYAKFLGYSVPLIKSESIAIFLAQFQKKNPILKKKKFNAAVGYFSQVNGDTLSLRCFLFVCLFAFSKLYIEDGLNF